MELANTFKEKWGTVAIGNIQKIVYADELLEIKTKGPMVYLFKQTLTLTSMVKSILNISLNLLGGTGSCRSRRLWDRQSKVGRAGGEASQIYIGGGEQST